MIRATTLNEKGFSLVEAIIAMAILAIGLLTLVTMQTTGIKGNANANNITIAAVGGADQIEKVFSWEYDDTRLNDDGLANNAPPNGAAGLDAIGAAADYQIPSIPDDPLTIYLNVAEDMMMPNTKSIRFIIIRDDMGVTKSVKMDYLKAKLM